MNPLIGELDHPGIGRLQAAEIIFIAEEVCHEFHSHKVLDSANDLNEPGSTSFCSWALRWECSMPDTLTAALCNHEQRIS